MSSDDSDDPTRKQPDELLAKALSPVPPPLPKKGPLPPPVWDEPEDEVPTDVLAPLPGLARPSPARRPQLTELDLAYRPLVVHPQPPAEGDAPYADTALRPRVIETAKATAFEEDDEEDPTIVIPILTPAAAQSVVPAGVPAKAPAVAVAVAVVKPPDNKRGR